jgi:ABC-type lipoprotein export system ATPase subunit
MIQIEDISFSYKEQKSMRFPDFSFDQGEHALVLGSSGCGKTTLLHLIAGLLSPQSGSIRVADKDITALNGGTMDAFRGQNIGVIFQKPHFVKSLTVVENVVLAQSLGGGTSSRVEAESFLQKLGLEDKINRRVTDLSEGEKQRVSIARALVNKPKLILADEPTSALDDENCKSVVQLLKQVSDEVGSTLLIVTHDHRLKEHFSKTVEL